MIRNSWYVAANPEELANHQIVSRKILGEQIALCRLETGAIIATLDRCPHRYAPLSLGSVEGNRLRCGYHGAAFDEHGACVDVPGQAMLPSNCRLTLFPVREQFGFVWIWLGRPDLAETTLPPSTFARSDEAGYVGGNGLFESMQAHFALVSDNLFDLTHADYVHKGSLGGGEVNSIYRRMKPGTEFIDGRMTFEVTENQVTARMLALGQGDDAAPFFRQIIAAGIDQPDFDGAIDIETEITWAAPAFTRFQVVINPTHDRTRRFSTVNLHALTPEADGSSHYFFRTLRDFQPEQAVTVGFLENFRQIFTEDLAMLEAQQSRIGDADLFDLNPVSFAGDIVQNRVRSILKRLEAAERKDSDA